MAGGRLFQTRGPATANAVSPSDVVVRGMSSIILAADSEPGRPRPAKTEVVGQIAWCSVLLLLSPKADVHFAVSQLVESKSLPTYCSKGVQPLSKGQ